MDPELQALLAKVPLLQQRGAQPQEIDEWIASKTGGQYSTLAAAQRAGQPSAPVPGGKSPGLMGLLDPFLQGATMNFADEGVGRIQSLLPGQGDYATNRDKFRAEEAQVRAEHPILSKLAYGAGSLATGFGLLRGLKPAIAAPGVLSTMAKGAAVGAGMGAVGAAGDAPELSDVPGAAVTGAAVGAPFGAAGAVIFPALLKAGLKLPNVIGKLFSSNYRDNAYARQMVLRALQESGTTAEQAQAMLADMERHAPGQPVLADVSPRLSRELRASVNSAPALDVPVRDALATRQAGQASRVATAVEDNMGVTGADAMDARQQAAASLPSLGRRVYGTLENTPLPTQGPAVAQLYQVLRQPEVAQLLTRANPSGGPVTFKTLQDLRAQMADLIGSPNKLATMQNVKQWFQTQLNDLTDAMESAFPGYKLANGAYRTAATFVGEKDPVTGLLMPTSKLGAFNLGARALSADAADVARITDVLRQRGGAEAVDAYRMGFLEKLTTQLRGLTPNKNALNAIPGLSGDAIAPEAETKLRLLFPTREGMTNFLARMRTEGMMLGTKAAMGNSTTAQQGADMGAAAFKASLHGAGGIKSFLTELLANGMGSGARARELAGRMLLTPSSGMPGVMDALQGGPAAQLARRPLSSLWSLLGAGAGAQAGQSPFQPPDQ